MQDSIDILKERYLTNIKENPDLYIGIELEFPIVNLEGGATDTRVTKELLARLNSDYSFIVERRDLDGNPIQLKASDSEDRILFEVSYNILEFAFEKAKIIQEVEIRFNHYLDIIQQILRKDHHELQGHGLHPFWKENDNQPVKYPRYQMLMQYLALSEKIGGDFFHRHPDYGGYICGSQVQLDVSRANFIQVINAFNQIEAAKAYFFANSELITEDFQTKIARDRFWEESMHGLLVENVGVNPYDFKNEEDFFNYLNHTAIFNAEREGDTYYFPPIAAGEYLKQGQIKGYNLSGRESLVSPRSDDFYYHRSYQYQDLTTRGTIEFRSTCAQPLNRTFAPAAFHLGLLANLEEVTAYLKDCDFFKLEGRAYKDLRRKYSQIDLTQTEQDAIRSFASDLLQLAIKGLKMRKKGEERYLFPLVNEV
ncbi:gamma-glutamylcysteine synthetase putative [Streptococcus cristatus]|uniref:glutamate--cysteine ligase n=2 Tax=Streptococcus cristatus TaxID=45634 RepID=A0A512ACS5_STRCR|nr:gamma-glutamylcysteine synthetase [Streptococcus cristatus]GEN97486.1 hypothetical protein SOL01_13600 [Streptococcus cristatus]SQI45449.1 gamma-glutamylcysteine synthetase putative [Streptococcus cristatus]